MLQGWHRSTFPRKYSDFVDYSGQSRNDDRASRASAGSHGQDSSCAQKPCGIVGVAGMLGSVDFATPIGNLAVLGLGFNGLAFTSGRHAEARPTKDPNPGCLVGFVLYLN